MPTGQKIRLRAVTAEERQTIDQLARAQSAPAVVVAWATMLQAVADGATCQAAAQAAGRRNRDTVTDLVVRFNAEGLGALVPRPRGHPPYRYGPEEADRILQEVRRTPDPEQDGAATWSLTLLQRAVRRAPDGLPAVSTWTIFQVLHDAGYSWQEKRTWCKTGVVQRKRRGKIVEVTDPQAETKKG
ncbi:MAG: helix-turn-helix domain-containing protein [Armatimonadota bacterium]